MKNVLKFVGIIAIAAVIGFSMAACGNPDNGPGPGPLGGVLPAPMGLNAIAISSSEINLTWNAVNGAVGYRVYYGMASLSVSLPLGNTTFPSYSVTGASPGTTYYFQVTALALNGAESGRSNTAPATTNSGIGGGGAPATPTGLTATASSSTQINLTWNAVLGATSYTVYYGTTASSVSTNLGTTTNASYTFTNANPGTTYYFQVTATNANGESGRSSTTSATTQSGSGGGGGNGTQANPIALSNNVWTPGSITASAKEQWFSFPVTAGQTYRVWWDDGGGFSSRKYTCDVVVTGTHSDGTVYFEGEDHAWNESGWGGATVKQFLVTANGTVKLKVVPYSSSRTGTFAIVYSYNMFHSRPSDTGEAGSDELHPIPLTAGVWKLGNIASDNGELWYSITATDGSMYWVWWDDSWQGSGTYSGDINVRAWYSDGKDAFSGGDNGWSTPSSFLANKNDTVKVKVSVDYSSGTYAIVYNTRNSRP